MRKTISDIFAIHKVCIEKKKKVSPDIEKFKYVYFIDKYAVATDKYVVAMLDLKVVSNLDKEDLRELNGRAVEAKVFEQITKGVNLSIKEDGIIVTSPKEEDVFFSYAEESVFEPLRYLVKKINSEDKEPEGIDNMVFNPIEIKKICDVLKDYPCKISFYGNHNIVKIEDESLGLKIAFYHQLFDF